MTRVTVEDPGLLCHDSVYTRTFDKCARSEFILYSNPAHEPTSKPTSKTSIYVPLSPSPITLVHRLLGMTLMQWPVTCYPPERGRRPLMDLLIAAIAPKTCYVYIGVYVHLVSPFYATVNPVVEYLGVLSNCISPF
jgi:hypothetical protein